MTRSELKVTRIDTGLRIWRLRDPITLRWCGPGDAVCTRQPALMAGVGALPPVSY
jgi:hypothetical protein